ncbi:MAG: hypothetical protein DMF88_06665 [Acidobacteria bacterium]|nr:MAG: hypothetical protein DMF88_06665 [Acidobacteriota bacterium]
MPVKELRVGSSRGPGNTPRPGSLQALYKPDALAKWRALSDKDDPALRCIPVAFGTLNVSLFGLGFVGQIVQTPKFVVMLTETYHGFKLIPTDGRAHRDDAAPSYRGDSVGRWDGDTLVVDTTNFTDENWMYAEGNTSFHSDALRVVERYRRTAANLLEVDVQGADADAAARAVRSDHGADLREHRHGRVDGRGSETGLRAQIDSDEAGPFGPARSFRSSASRTTVPAAPRRRL